MRARSMLAAIAALSGCTLADFRDLESNATTVTVRSNTPFPSQTFGSVLASYRVSTAGHELSRIVSATGPLAIDATTVDGIVGTYGFWQDGRLDLGETVYTACDGVDATCPEPVGVRVVPIRDLRGAHGCILATAPASSTPEVAVLCESSMTTASTSKERLPAPASTTPTALFGAGAAAVPDAAAAIGLAFVGAPGTGEVHVMADDGSFVPLAFGAFAPDPASGFGATMASAPIAPVDPADAARLPVGTSFSFLAVTAQAERRVRVFVVRNAAGVGTDAVLAGCIDGPTVAAGVDDGFGSVLTAGDLDADGMPELVIGSAITASARANEVRVVSLHDVLLTMGTGDGCTDPASADDPTTRVLACPTDASGEVTCEGFGSALAIGDVDGTAERDLLVGAPHASVGNVSHAGAAFVFSGNASLDAFVSSVNEPARLVDSHPDVNDTLGFAVTFAASQLVVTGATPREEPIASAPGANRLFVFLCSGLANDAAQDGTARCIAEE